MDNRRLIVAMLLTVALVFVWQPLIDAVGRGLGYDMDAPARQTEQGRQAERLTDPDAPTSPDAPATPPLTSVPGVDASPAPPDVASLPMSGRLTVLNPAAMPGEAVELVPLGAERRRDPTFSIGLRATPLGAGVASVTLNDYLAEAGGRTPYVFQTVAEPDSPGLSRRPASMAVLSATIDGRTVGTADVPWRTESVTTEGDVHRVVFALTLGLDGEPVATLRRTITLLPRTATPPGLRDGPLGYEPRIDLTVQNHTDRALTFAASINGPAVPPRELAYGIDRQIIGGYDDRGVIAYRAAQVERLTPDRPTLQFAVNDDGTTPFVWAGASSIYYNAIVRPVAAGDEPATRPAAAYAGVEAAAINPQSAPLDRDVSITFLTRELSVAAGGTLDLPLATFFGPKWRRVVDNAYFSAPAIRYDKTLIQPSFCSFCVFDSIIRLLVWLLGAFHFVFRDWGLAIIGLVVLVRTLLHPITKRSQLSMMKMGKLGPEMERLRKKYGDDKESLNREVMQLYKSQGFTPILGCLPMFLQMPIWIALWQALNSTFELRHAPFLWGLTWINDLSKPDHLIDFAAFGWPPVSLLFIVVDGLNILPLLLAVVFYIQMRIQPKPATMTPEQEQQQKIMMWMMPVLFPLFLYSSPSGLTLYILTSTVIGIVESKIVRDGFKKQEEAAAQQVIVDPEPVKATATRKAPEPPKGRLGSWLSDLQKKAQDMQRRADDMRRDGDRKANKRA